jgi:hypothetical protein
MSNTFESDSPQAPAPPAMAFWVEEREREIKPLSIQRKQTIPRRETLVSPTQQKETKKLRESAAKSLE